MKSQILLSFIALFFVSSIAAQPIEHYGGFNPDDLCKFKEGKTIFVGRVVSTKTVSNDSFPEILKDPNKQRSKLTVSVEKVFNGQFKLQEIREIFFTGIYAPFKKNAEHIFLVDELSHDESKFFKMVDFSVPLSEYKGEERIVRFSRIEERISHNYKTPPLFGIVLQTDASPEKRSLDLYLSFGRDAETNKGVPGITVLVRRKKNGQIYKAVTNEKGVFTFDKLEDGEYDLSVIFPKGFEQGFSYDQNTDNERLATVDNNYCRIQGVVYKIRKIKKP